MEQYIPKAAVLAEIEKRKMCLVPKMTFQHQRGELEHLLSFLDTLEVKEVDLNEEIEKCLKKHSMLAVGKKDFTEIAKHFFELGLQSTLTEEDMKLIWTLGDEIPYMAEEDFYKELLKRFKAQKGEEI